MESRYKPMPTLFRNRLSLVIIFIAGAFLGLKLLPRYFYILNIFDQSLVFSLVLIGAIVVWFMFFRTVENPFLTSIIPLMMLFWMVLDQFMSATVRVSVKPHMLALGFILAAGAVILYRNFKYLWEFQIVRYLAIFAVINVIYFFFHSSDFNVTEHGAAFGASGSSYGQDAKFIVFLDSLISLTAFCVPAVFFARLTSKEQLDSYVNKIGIVFLISFLAYFIFLPVTIKCLPTGKQIFLPLVFFFMLGLKVYIDNNFNKSNRFNFSYFIVFTGVAFLILYTSNKAALMGFLGSFAVFLIFSLFFIKNKVKIISIKRQKYIVPAIVSVLFIIAFFIAAQFNILDLAIEKYNRFFSSFSGITSWYIRKSNWNYFFLEWQHHLDVLSTLFGFGLGASREAIFYISAMQYSRIYLVQTIHNQYMEMFYDYGLVALLFYIPILRIAFRDFFIILKKDADRNIKTFCAVNLTMTAFFFVYHIADGLRVQTAIMYFSFLAFNEMAKRFLCRDKAQECSYTKMSYTDFNK